jgi:NAD(P) transhydrogenase
MAVNITISGITAIGALHLMGGGYYPTNIIESLSAVAALISFVNVFGGFVAVQRMLNVYRRPNDPPGTYNRKHVLRRS